MASPQEAERRRPPGWQLEHRSTRAPGGPRRLRLAGAALAAASLLAVAAACGDDGAAAGTTTTTTTAAGEPTTTTSESPPTTEDASDDEAEVLAAYEAGWRAYIEAGRSGAGAADPGLTETSTGAALAGFRDTLRGLSEQQRRFGPGMPVLQPEVVEIDGDTARIVDCIQDTVSVVAEDGTEVEAPTGLHYEFTVTMIREEERWKRATADVGEVCEP